MGTKKDEQLKARRFPVADFDYGDITLSDDEIRVRLHQNYPQPVAPITIGGIGGPVQLDQEVSFEIDVPAKIAEDGVLLKLPVKALISDHQELWGFQCAR